VSFKLKLLFYFGLLALLPIAISFYGYASLAQRSATQRADARLDAELRASTTAYATRLDEAAADAQRLAATPSLQAALLAGDRSALAAAIRATPHAAIRTSSFLVGAIPPATPTRRVDVRRGTRLVGSVVVSVPLDAALIARLSAPLARGDLLVGLGGGRVQTGPGRGASVSLRPGDPARVVVADRAFRGLAGPALPGAGGRQLAVLTPQHAIDTAAGGDDTRLVLAVLGALAVVGLVTYVIGRSIVRTLRRLVAATDSVAAGRLETRVDESSGDEFGQLARAFNRMAGELEDRLAEIAAERRRVHGVAAGLASALAGTHDEESLLRAVVESAVQAAGGTAGVIVNGDTELARVGEPAADADRLSFPLRTGESDYGTLTVYGTAFEAEGVEIAAALAAQTVTALENARRHRVVEQHAVVDELTGLANRRLIDATLRTALSEAAHTGTPVTLVLADLDRFKEVNDRHGHPVGDRVLTTFARVLEDVTRDQDLAGRWGGEEFALVLGNTGLEAGAAIAERARRALEESSTALDGTRLSVTASFGVASHRPHTELADLVQAADGALYAAKRAGRNRVVLAEPD
jgi:diguanylate cyclase (GGDEF)-like protein